MAEKVVQLNAYQKAVVDFRAGYAVCMASPGSGKTAVVVQRILALLREGVQQNEILSLTFTKSGAKEMRERADLSEDTKVFSTFHSWALAFVKREAFALPFKVKTDFHGVPAPLLLPLDACRLLAKICRFLPDKVQWKDAQSFISRMKRRGVSPSQAHREMENDGEEKFIAAYAKYEAALREQGVLDFDSIVIETANLLKNREDVRRRNQYRFVQVDEAQDTDAVQWSIIKAVTQRYGNALAVGDENQGMYSWRGSESNLTSYFTSLFPGARIFPLPVNYRCHPPGQMISVCTKNNHGGHGAKDCGPVIEQVPIEHVQDGQMVVSWDKRSNRYRTRGRSVKITKHEFSGQLLKITCGSKVTSVTPTHRMLVRFNPDAAVSKYAVYLMWREDRGFRVGQCALFSKFGTQGKRVFRLYHRIHKQRPDKLWLLNTCSTEKDARVLEEITSVTFGITQTEFVQSNPKPYWTDEELTTIFGHLPAAGGFACLQRNGLLFDAPLYSKGEDGIRIAKGFRHVAAANVMPEIMEVPVVDGTWAEAADPHHPSWKMPIGSVEKFPYNGTVYSLEVPYEHTYVVNGIAVGNSTQEIVEYCKEIAPNQNETITGLITPNEKGIAPYFRLYCREDEEAKAVIESCQDLGNTAVLARTNRQLACFENECANRNLRYKLLGKSGFWSQREVKDVLSIVGAVVKPTDTNIMGALKARCELTKFIRKADTRDHKGVPSTLEDMQARQVDGTSLNSLLLRYQGDGAEAVHNVAYQLRELRSEIRNLSGEAGTRRIIDRFGVLSAYDEDDNKDENVDNDPRENVLKMVEFAGRKKSAAEFFDWTIKVQRGLRARTDALTLSTIHQSKGKEWPYVFVVGVNQDVLPHIKGELEEERRIFFVACSRAAKKLHVSANGVASDLIRHKLPTEGSGVIDPWEGFSLLQH